MSNDIENNAPDVILPDDPAAGDNAAVAESTKDPKMFKRTVALHVGYVGTGYKGEACTCMLLFLSPHACPRLPLTAAVPSAYLTCQAPLLIGRSGMMRL